MKELAKVIRWRVLADRPHSAEEIDLILSADSLTRLTQLAWMHTKKIYKQLLLRWRPRGSPNGTARQVANFVRSGRSRERKSQAEYSDEKGPVIWRSTISIGKVGGWVSFQPLCQ